MAAFVLGPLMVKLLLYCYVASSAIDFDSFDFKMYLDSSETFLIAWTVDSTKTNITIAVSAPTTGWAAIGVSPTGQMPEADIALFWVDDTDSTVNLQDRYTSTSRSTPTLDENQNLILIEGEQLNGKTNIVFKRAIRPCDADQDYPIVTGTSRVIFAYSPNNNDMFSYHQTNRQSRSVNLLDGTDLQVDLEPDYLTFDVVVNNYNMPIAKTTYYETYHELPVNGSVYHIIKMEPIVTTGNELHVHHLVAYYCDSPPPTSCTTAAYAWAIGGEGMTFPADVGLEMSANYLHWVKLQIHYDNPDQVSNVFDSSGLRVYYTPSLRDNDAGLMEFGLALGTWQFIPPGMEQALNTAYCMSECTGAANAFPSGGIKVFSVFLHAHVLGTALELKHIRDGVELPPLAQNWAYDFDYQQSTPLAQHIQVLPGDELILDCFYDSTGFTSITYGGESTTDEMCQAYVYAYPRPTLGRCESKFTDPQISAWYNLAAQAGYLTGTDETDYAYNLGGNAFTYSGITWQNGEDFYNYLWQEADLPLLSTRDQRCKDITGADIVAGAFEIPNGYTAYVEDVVCTTINIVDDGDDNPSSTSQATGGCSDNDVLQAGGTADNFEINVQIDCQQQTVSATITFSDYQQNWFAVVWSNKMIGNALIWTSNNPANNEAVRAVGLYSYTITDRVNSMVRYDGTALDWNKISETTDGSKITIEYQQDLSKTKGVFSLDTEAVDVRWAHGSNSLVLAQHTFDGRASSTLGLNLLTGETTLNEDDMTLESAHGVIMWITWAVLASYGIMSSAFRFLYPDGPKWFYIHRSVQCVVVILDLIGFIIAIVFTVQKEKAHFANPHMIMGLVVTILCVLQPINAYFRAHQPTSGWQDGVKPAKRIVWEYVHRGSGYIAWILGVVTAHLGLKLIGETTLANVHLFGWGVLLLIIYIIFSILKYVRMKQQKEVTFDSVQATPTNANTNTNINTDGTR